MLRLHRPNPSLSLLGLACAVSTASLAGGCGDSNSAPQPTLDSGSADGFTPLADAAPSISEDTGIPAAPDGATSSDPLAALQGDYLRRVDTNTHGQNSALGEVTTESSSYGVVRVVLQDGKLVGTERLCHYDVAQTAGLGTVKTTVSDTTWPNLTPVERSFEVDLTAGTWSSPGATRRQGWRASAGSMPTDPANQADDFLDPDEDGKPGVATRVEGMVFVVTADCQYDMVSSATTEYVMGTLDASGLLAGANVNALDSAGHALTAEQLSGSTPCAVEDINDSTPQTIDSDVLRLSRVDEQWLADPQACPSKAEFQAVLP